MPMPMALVAPGMPGMTGQETPGYTAQALALFARMTPQPATTWKRGYDAAFRTPGFISAIANCDFFNFWGSHTSQAALINWAGATDSTIHGTMAHIPREGFTSDGTTGYIGTNILHNAGTKFLQDANSGLFFVNRVLIATTTTGMALGLSSSTDRYRLQPQAGGALATARNNSATTFNGANADIVTGAWHLTRTASTASAIKRGTTSIATSATASSALTAQELVFFKNSASFAVSTTQGLWGAYGGPLSDADVTAITAAIDNLLAVVAASPSAPSYTTATLSTTYPIPDGQGSTAGKGITCTGLARLPNGTWPMGNFGLDSDQSSPPNAPSLCIMSADFTTKLAEFDLSGINTTLGPQGVCVDTVAGTIWHVGQDTNAYQINATTGAAISNIPLGFIGNALTYDSIQDCLIVGDAAYAMWRDKTTGVILRYINLGLSGTPDHFWFDAAHGERGQLWVTSGSNGVAGIISVLDIATRTIVRTISAGSTFAIEGIWNDGAGNVYIANDTWFHNHSGVNCVQKYALS